MSEVINITKSKLQVLSRWSKTYLYKSRQVHYYVFYSIKFDAFDNNVEV